ncbi:hypothetical protein CHGG_11069 [Chaetomium globosum CBS 148.51]|uniref:Rhodopsin domain-containing protein n=1 Tax=Chaetomium globosum (strain ATCC 6205 / CBS 148.51 / DSM 1962 / NBRC 6347 / NRRL 1970) TaxID=306901 RepID=Q2GLY7_CHAGB|nr:uncharacterized protein CHGG_11069 [Chaetomium globosum CBS 148.51]EAQ82893.1 hypothetical protein CHGG_11069 [Chaetomium globosum CBS 148.51]
MASTDSDNVGDLSHQSLLILIWVSFSAAFFLVALRTVIRIRSPATRQVAPLEDCWIFLALAALLALCILETIQLPSQYYITGVLSGAIPPKSFKTVIAHTERYLLFQFPIVILFWTVLWSVKAAFLALYWRLFRDLTWYRRFWFVLAVFTFLAYGGCVTTLVLSCGPDVRNFFAFNKCAGPQSVWSSNFSVYFSTAVDVFTDLCIMAMPLRLIYNVKVSLKQKLGLRFLVGTLPALKVLITTTVRASENRSGDGSRGTQRKNSIFTHKSVKSAKSVALGSLKRDSHNPRSVTGSNTDATESQEEILVQRDVTVSYTPVPRPSPTRYHQRYQEP